MRYVKVQNVLGEQRIVPENSVEEALIRRHIEMSCISMPLTKIGFKSKFTFGAFDADGRVSVSLHLVAADPNNLDEFISSLEDEGGPPAATGYGCLICTARDRGPWPWFDFPRSFEFRGHRIRVNTAMGMHCDAD